jgi:hypothetical protein
MKSIPYGKMKMRMNNPHLFLCAARVRLSRAAVFVNTQNAQILNQMFVQKAYKKSSRN